MEPGTYEVEAELEASHWWFRGRRRLFRRVIRACAVGPETRFLDVGTSTGGNLRMLDELGYANVVGVDPSPEAVRHCARKGLPLVRQADVCRLPFEDASFDVVLAGDVLEHVDDDAAALREIRRVLGSGGTLLVSVPAFRMLWSRFDDVARHKRRYRIGPLRARVEDAGFELVESFYFNYLLFPAILGARRLMRITGREVENENTLGGGLANRLLDAIFALDVASARWIHPPFGVSIFALARRGS